MPQKLVNLLKMVDEGEQLYLDHQLRHVEEGTASDDKDLHRRAAQFLRECPLTNASAGVFLVPSSSTVAHASPPSPVPFALNESRD